MELITDAQLEEVAYYLLGTCQTEDHALSAVLGIDGVFDLSSEDEDRLNFAIERVTFNCNTCGWWCEMGSGGDNNGEWICEQCEGDQDEEADS
jgi:hypothetical protein